MSIDINWVAILAGAVSSVVLGMVWYAPGVFGKKWMKAVGLNMKEMNSRQMGGMVAATVRSFVLSFALFHIITVTAAFYTDSSFLANALGVGAWVSVAIVSIALVMHDTFEQKSMIATKVNVGYEVVSIMTAAYLIGLIAG